MKSVAALKHMHGINYYSPQQGNGNKPPQNPSPWPGQWPEGYAYRAQALALGQGLRPEAAHQAPETVKTIGKRSQTCRFRGFGGSPKVQELF